MLFRHLMSLDLEVVNSTGKTGQNGPDFGVKFGGKTIWLEAIVPSPNGVPSDYLQPPTSGIPKVVRKPDTERVLRCTSAISEKLRKLNDYKSKGIVDENECFVIAVNICRLSDWDVDGCGISQFPLSLEAVLPIGHLALPLSSNGKVDGPAQNITRDKLIKFNGSEIVTTGFLNQNLSGVSAILQGHQKHLLEVKLDLSVIHNPNSQNPLPSKLLGSRKEFVTVVGDEEIEVNDIAAVIGNG